MLTLQEKFIHTNERLNNELNYIIQAFINFYGEDYKDYISNELNNLKIIWYDDTQQNIEVFRNSIISSLPENVINEYLKRYNKKCFSQSAYINEIDVLVLPLSYDMTHIIHEINHKLSTHILALKPMKMISGLCISIEKNGRVIIENNDFNEALNQKMTLEILNELKKLGLNINYTSSWQENLFPLINMFYELFKDCIKQVYITGDIFSLIKNVGNENYVEYSQLMFLKCFKLRRMIIKDQKPNLSEDEIKKLENIVNNMKQYYDKSRIEHYR